MGANHGEYSYREIKLSNDENHHRTNNNNQRDSILNNGEIILSNGNKLLDAQFLLSPQINNKHRGGALDSSFTERFSSID